MISALRDLAALLPDVWPLKGKGIKIEDWLAQAELDLLFGRDPKATGSLSIVTRAGKLSHKGLSQNHRKTEATVVLMRDGNPEPLQLLLDEEREIGQCYKEQGARYQPRFHTRDAAAALLYLASRPTVTREQRELRDSLIEWLAGEWWWLRRHALGDVEHEHCEVYPCGCRREFAGEDLDGIQLDVFEQRTVDVRGRYARAFGLKGKGSIMNGGMPRSCAEWFLLAARADCLLPKEPREPKLAIPVEVEREAGYILSYFPKLHWRPGQGPILVAVEMRREWDAPRQWISPDKTPLPAEYWGWNPMHREIVAA